MSNENFECNCGFQTTNWNEWDNHKEFECKSYCVDGI